ncbi:hypothetical protein FRC020322_02117 [Corynebacterium diphtheriae]|nr:hypothetical protein FRC020322_02117 [Corynebacterium diphtheriae]
MNGGNLPANPSQSQPSHDCENVPLRVEPRPNPRRTNQCTLKPEEPPNGGISKHFSPNFTPNRFQTGRLTGFGVKCRLFGGERGWRAPTPTNASQSQPSHGCEKRPTPRSATPPTSDTKSMHSKTGRVDKLAGPIFPMRVLGETQLKRRAYLG